MINKYQKEMLNRYNIVNILDDEIQWEEKESKMKLDEIIFLIFSGVVLGTCIVAAWNMT